MGREGQKPRRLAVGLLSCPGRCGMLLSMEDMICSVTECARKAHCRGLCDGHYSRLKRKRPIEGPLRESTTTGKYSRVRDSQGNKCCSICNRWLPPTDFWTQKTTLDGLKSACKHCSVPAQRLRRYNITQTEYDALWETQGFACAICRTQEDSKWCIDHDHACCDKKNSSCGKCIRGILCHKCNVGLAMFDDKIEYMTSAIKYITGEH